MLLYYSRPELYKFKDRVLVVSAETISSYFHTYLKEIIRKDISTYAMVDDSGRNVFTEGQEYYIMMSFPGNKSILDRRIPFDPFDEQSWDFSQYRGCLDVYDSNDNCILPNNSVRFIQNTLSYCNVINQEAAVAMADILSDFFNSEQQWYTLGDYVASHSALADIIDRKAVEDKYLVGLDDPSVIADIYRSINKAIVSLIRHTPTLEVFYNVITSDRRRWDIIETRVRNGIIEVSSLGDVRILEFERNLLESSDN